VTKGSSGECVHAREATKAVWETGDRGGNSGGLDEDQMSEDQAGVLDFVN
jgi:hypothetical protein